MVRKLSPYIGDIGSGVPGDAYSEADWAKHGLHDSASSLRQTQQNLRAAMDAGELKSMTKREEVEFLNIATAESRKVVSKADMVNLPPHYARFKIEPIRFIAENKLDWFQGNIVKYVLRHDAKNGSEDIRKTIRYANMYLLYLAGDPDWWQAGKPEDFKVAA